MMKKTKNYIRIVAVLLAVVTVFTVPVSAEENVLDSHWINMFDYGFQSYYPVTSGSSTLSVSFPMPFERTGYYCDALIECDGSISNVAAHAGYLNVVPIMDDLYRIYGILEKDLSYINYTFLFYLSNASYVKFLSCNLSLSNYSLLLDSCSFSSSFVGSSKSATYTDSPVSITFPVLTGATTDELTNFNTNISLENWKKFDYMDVSFSIRASSLSSINVNFNDVSIPFEMTYVNLNMSSPLILDCDGWFDSTNEIYEEEYFANFSSTYVNVQLRLDLTGLNRTFSGFPTIVVNCGAQPIDGCAITVHGCNGYVEMDVMDPEPYWLQSIYDVLSTIESNNRLGFVNVQNRLDTLRSSFGTWFETVNDYQSQQLTEQQIISQNILYIGEQISGYIYNLEITLKDVIGNLQANVVLWFNNIKSLMERQFEDMTTLLTDKFKAVTDRLDKLIGGTTEGDELSDGAADLEDQAGDIHDFEQSQQAVLDNNFDAIQGAVTFTGFTAALAFVQRYINFSWSGIQGFSVIYTLPIFIGLFFFVCGRIPGATRWRSRPPKDGGSA